MSRHSKFFYCFCILITVVSCTTVTKNKLSLNIPPLHLVLALDGVGFRTFKKLYDGGYFRDFNQPSQMVASFPSLSDPNWARLLRAPIGTSYTKSYFDMSVQTSSGQGQAVGSLLNHLTTPPKYEEGFDFKAEGLLQHFAMLTWTETSALYWLDAMEKQLRQTRDKTTFFAFIMNTDIIAHIQGEKALMEYLVIVDKRIKKLREDLFKEYGYNLDVTLVSDHGNYFITPQPINFEETFKKYNWKLVDSISKNNDVGLVIPEILAFGSFNCKKGNERRLALDLSKTEGIHITAYVSGLNTVRIISKSGEAEISVSPNTLTVDYRMIKGVDPLNQLNYFKKGYLSWKDYFILSYESEFPYSAVRIWEAFYKNAEQSGSVLASPNLGRVFANQTLKVLTMMKGLSSTHGSLHKEEAWGLLVSTKDSYPPIRPEDFGVYIPLNEYHQNLQKKPK